VTCLYSFYFSLSLSLVRDAKGGEIDGKGGTFISSMPWWRSYISYLLVVRFSFELRLVLKLFWWL